MKSRLGFTIIEVSLFLAISALLFVGIAAGTGINIARQRYNNAVEDYAEFLRRLYSATEDVQNEHGDRGERRTCTVRENDETSTKAKEGEEEGRTECALYGRIAIFNSKTDNSDTDRSNDKIMVYDVVGDIIDHESDRKILNGVTDTLSALAAVHAEFLAFEKNDENANAVVYSGNSLSYTPDWGSHIENTSDPNTTSEDTIYWSGAVMIVRSPIDGSIHTYVLNLNGSHDTEAGSAVQNTSYTRIFDPAADGNISVATSLGQVKSSHAYLYDYLTSSNYPKFEEAVVNFCVNSDDSYAYNGRRRNVRIKADGTNSSAVELIEFDSEDNKCL
ncbi:hypothetical protein IJJ18_01690 [Candidatus Saccharibacteria bacterium]|nr:hypothetical protein [Candidatus Saccharibacteria bacterium]